MSELVEQNLPLYHIFNAVAETGNISHAAKDLYISQPAISKAITRLEENLDTKLFERSSRGVTLTDEGRTLYDQTSAAFRHIKKAEDTLRHNNELGIGHLRIGVSTTLARYVLLPYLKEFTKHYPHIRISISCQSTYQTLALLSAKKIDIGLIGQPSRLESYEFDSLGAIEDIFVATPEYMENLYKRHPEAKSNPFEYANIMLLDQENISRHHIDEYMRENELFTGQLMSGRILEVSSMDLLIEFSKVSLGIACVIKQFVEEELKDKTLTEIKLKNPVRKREIGFSYLRDTSDNEAVKMFTDLVHEMRDKKNKQEEE